MYTVCKYCLYIVHFSAVRIIPRLFTSQIKVQVLYVYYIVIHVVYWLFIVFCSLCLLNLIWLTTYHIIIVFCSQCLLNLIWLTTPLRCWLHLMEGLRVHDFLIQEWSALSNMIIFARFVHMYVCVHKLLLDIPVITCICPAVGHSWCFSHLNPVTCTQKALEWMQSHRASELCFCCNWYILSTDSSYSYTHGHQGFIVENHLILKA